MREGKLVDAWVIARGLAERHPGSAETQWLAAEMAYRNARWKDAVTYFERGGDPGDNQPLRLFYLAVTRYESGDRAGAASVLRRCLSGIAMTDYVKSYREKILGPAAQ